MRLTFLHKSVGGSHEVDEEHERYSASSVGPQRIVELNKLSVQSTDVEH